MFETITQRFQKIARLLKSKGIVTSVDIDEVLRDIRRTLLEADVSLAAIKQLSANVKEKALGAKVISSLTPGQQVLKIIKDEVELLLGGTPLDKNLLENVRLVFVMGLQGSGKTTFCGKLALYLQKANRTSLLAPLDVHRPAAAEQLKTVSTEAGAEFLSNTAGKSVLKICEEARVAAKKIGIDTVIYDTAGRLQIDDVMMKELSDAQLKVRPDLSLLVLDSMTGQQAAQIASGFTRSVKVDAVVLTKLDSDTRGGAALSVFTETGKTILFSTSSEKLDQLDLFYPDRIASRIIGMGDVMTLIEKAEEIASTKEMEEMGKRVLKNEITLEDYLVQLNELKKMGPLNSVLEMLPGKGGLPKINLRVDDVMLQRSEAIIRSMTQEERRNPSIINSSRKQRIATGSGTQVNDINRLLKQFASLKLILSRVSKQRGGFLKKGLLGL